MELDKIKSDAELLPSMFRSEAMFRNQCRKERDEAVEKMNVKFNIIINGDLFCRNL
jgi:hypothetical protein